MSDMHEDDPAKVWELAKQIGTSMFVTHDGDRLEARPLQAYPDRDANVFYFMTDAANLLGQLTADKRVLISFADPGRNDWISVDGAAIVTDDREKIKELWSVWAKAFWDSPDDPRIRLITVNPDHARYWNAPNKLVTSIAMVASAISGKQPKLGTAGNVDL